jgi:hypothetical protein
MYILLFCENSPLTVEAPFNESLLKSKCDFRDLYDWGKLRDSYGGYAQGKKESFLYAKLEMGTDEGRRRQLISTAFILRKRVPVPESLSLQWYVQGQIYSPTF